MTRLAQKGFTLVELMIVVAIIGVLAVVAGTAYRRYMDSGRTAEAMAMLGEIRAKEEAYRAEFSTYAGWGAGGEAEANTLPGVDSQTCFASGAKEPCGKSVPATTWSGNWLIWQGLGINAPKSQLTCGYVVNFGSGVGGAGSGPTAGFPSGTIGQNFLGTTQTGTPWWYAVAICDNDGAGVPNASFSTASTTTSVYTQNEHK